MIYKPCLPSSLRLTFKDGLTYQQHAKVLCDIMATYYLDEFNRIMKIPEWKGFQNGLPPVATFPNEYLNKADALRDLQYLCEWWKIKAFELSNASSLHW